MTLPRKRQRSPSTSSDETLPYRSTRDPTLSPTSRTGHIDTDLETSDNDAESVLGFKSSEEPAKKRRRGLLRSKMERMGLVTEGEEAARQQAFPSVSTGWNLPPQQVPAYDLYGRPVNGSETSGFNMSDPSAQARIPVDELDPVAYPTTVESPPIGDDRPPSHASTSSSVHSGRAGSISGPRFEVLDDDDEEQDEDGMMMEDDGEGMNRPTNGARRARTWYEPEKDRIVVTSLSDSEDETDSPPHPTRPQQSGTERTRDFIDLDEHADVIDINHPAIQILDPDSSTTDQPNLFIQPGSKGFTISPSLLSRLNQLNEKQRAELSRGLGLGSNGRKFAWDSQKDRDRMGLILYKSGIAGNANGLGSGYSVSSISRDEDGLDTGGRFEMLGEGDANMDMGGMEIDSGSGMEVDDMEMG